MKTIQCNYVCTSEGREYDHQFAAVNFSKDGTPLDIYYGEEEKQNEDDVICLLQYNAGQWNIIERDVDPEDYEMIYND